MIIEYQYIPVKTETIKGIKKNRLLHFKSPVLDI